ncbi:hypothetical protein GCM10010341_09730 [Streptomyces noursei]|nr:hypothetical protein GCM10010341_09730 [Streptomyces noursei]
MGWNSPPGVSVVRETLEGYLTADPAAQDCRCATAVPRVLRPGRSGPLDPESRL